VVSARSRRCTPAPDQRRISVGDPSLEAGRLGDEPNLGAACQGRANQGPPQARPVDHWIISYCTRGAHSAITAGSSLEVPAKVPLLWSLGQEFLHERTHSDRVHVYMMQDAFRDIAPLLDAALGSVLDTPLGHLLGDYVIALERRLTELTEADLPRLSTAVGAMVAAAVAPSPQRIAVAGRQIDLGRKERVETGRPPPPAHANLDADDFKPGCRNVALESLSIVRKHGWCGAVHSARAASSKPMRS